mgnify:CR=1 FL=1
MKYRWNNQSKPPKPLKMMHRILPLSAQLMIDMTVSEKDWYTWAMSWGYCCIGKTGNSSNPNLRSAANVYFSPLYCSYEAMLWNSRDGVQIHCCIQGTGKTCCCILGITVNQNWCCILGCCNKKTWLGVILPPATPACMNLRLMWYESILRPGLAPPALPP